LPIFFSFSNVSKNYLVIIGKSAFGPKSEKVVPGHPAPPPMGIELLLKVSCLLRANGPGHVHTSLGGGNVILRVWGQPLV
jgi:hypothetical protein